MRTRYSYHLEPDDRDGQVHQFIIDVLGDEDRDEVLDWCQDQFGPPNYGEMPDWSHSAKGSSIWICDIDHAFAFRVRWC